MKFKKIIVLFVVCYIVVCGWLVLKSGIFRQGSGQSQNLVTTLASEATVPGATGAKPADAMMAGKAMSSSLSNLQAVGGEAKTIALGSTDPNSGY